MINVLILGMKEIKGGIEQLIYQIFSRLDKSKIRCDFLCYCPQCVYEDELKAAGSAVYHIARRGKHPLKCRQELKEFFKNHRNDYDYIWIHTGSASNCMAHKFAKQYTNAQIISHSHNTNCEGENLIHTAHVLLHKLHQKQLVRCTDFFFACSQAAGKWLYGSDSPPVTVIKNGVDPNKFQFNRDAREQIRSTFSLAGYKVIGHAGRFCAMKNQPFILDIFAAVLKRSAEYRLLLAGDGESLAEMKQKAAGLGIAEQVIFTGHREDMDRILQAFDLLLMPSLPGEGFPVIAVEAQASGLPCLLADTITKEISLTDLVSYRSLSDPAEQWAETVCSLVETHEKNDRAAYREIISKSGYDINETVKELERFLIAQKQRH